MKIHEYDAITNESILRDPTEQELAQQEIDNANAQAAKAILDAELAAKAAQKAALLERLGITEDEARLLLSQAQSPKNVLKIIKRLFDCQ